MKDILFSALILVGLGGCVLVENMPGSGGELIRIQQGNVVTFNELRLGVVNIIEVGHVDAAGAKGQGLMAALSLFVDGEPPQEKGFEVHAGQKIVMGTYSVYVEEIRGTTKGLVTLRIEDVSKSPTR